MPSGRTGRMPAYEFVTHPRRHGRRGATRDCCADDCCRPAPARPSRSEPRLDVLTFVSNWLLASLAAAAAPALQPRGLMASLGWAAYRDTHRYPHRRLLGRLFMRLTMHIRPAIWPFDRIHHSDTFVDVTTTFRTHQIETVWRLLFAIVPIWIFGTWPGILGIPQELASVCLALRQNSCEHR
jgi:hypothetical protein